RRQTLDPYALRTRAKLKIGRRAEGESAPSARRAALRGLRLQLLRGLRRPWHRLHRMPSHLAALLAAAGQQNSTCRPLVSLLELPPDDPSPCAVADHETAQLDRRISDPFGCASIAIQS